jgi:hypothetical protein
VRCLVDDSDKQSKYVKVIADLGKGEPFDAGHCHPSQARILVKKKLAEWRDGKLLVMLRPVHIAVAMNTLTLPGEDQDVSEEEVQRRQGWFRAVVRGVLQSDTHGSDLGKILGYHLDEGMRIVGPRDTLNLIQALSFRKQEELREKLDWLKKNADPEPDDSTDDSWYDQDADPPSVTDKDLLDAWCFVSGVGVPNPEDSNYLERCGVKRIEGYDVLHPTPVYRPEDIEPNKDGNPGVLLIPVPFTKMARSDEVKKRDGTFMQKSATRKCPTCGQGEDTDGDGNCHLCKSFLKIGLAR